MLWFVQFPAACNSDDWTSQALEESGLPKKLRMVVMCNKPSFEFRAFQVRGFKHIALDATYMLAHDQHM